MRLIDSHCHLQAAQFAADRAAVVLAAREAGVQRIVAPGWDLASSEASRSLAAGDAGIGAAVGVHPHHAAEIAPDGWARIEAWAEDPLVVAIGETVLDYDRARAPRAAQLANLRRHLAVAARLGKPVILHCRSLPGHRDAQDDLLAELRVWLESSAAGAPASASGASVTPRREGRPPAILHSFSGPVDYARTALDLGLMISFSGLVFRAGEEASAEVARLAPAERLLVETDAPYLAPPGAPKRRNEPRFVEVTARWLAARRAADLDLLGDLLVANHDFAFGSSR